MKKKKIEKKERKKKKNVNLAFSLKLQYKWLQQLWQFQEYFLGAIHICAKDKDLFIKNIFYFKIDHEDDKMIFFLVTHDSKENFSNNKSSLGN